MDDLQLIAAYLAGDISAFEILVERHNFRVRQTAHSILRNTADTDEIVQIVWFVVYRKVWRFSGDSAFSSWLYRVTANEALMRLRTIRRRPVIALEPHLIRYVASPLETDARAIVNEFRARLTRCMAKLSPEHRQVIHLRTAGLTDQETAAALDIPRGTEKKRYHLAKHALRDQLKRAA